MPSRRSDRLVHARAGAQSLFQRPRENRSPCPSRKQTGRSRAVVRLVSAKAAPPQPAPMITTSAGSMRFLVISREDKRELRFFANPDISSQPCRTVSDPWGLLSIPCRRALHWICVHFSDAGSGSSRSRRRLTGAISTTPSLPAIRMALPLFPRWNSSAALPSSAKI